MNSELIAALDYFEREKGIKREILIEAVSNALLQASKKSVGPARDLRIDINPKSGEIRAMASLVVAERVQDKFSEVLLANARKIKPDAQVGDSVDIEVTPRDFGRISAQTAKQAMLQRIRSAEKEMMYDEFKDRAGEIVSGTVRRFERSDVIVDLGKFDAIMPSKERVVTEDYNVGDRLRAYVMAVENGVRGPEIILSRSHPNSSAASLKWRSARSTTAPWRFAGWRARPATARKSRCIRPTKKSIPSARASACAAAGSRISCANSTTRRWTSSAGRRTSAISSPTRSNPAKLKDF